MTSAFNFVMRKMILSLSVGPTGEIGIHQEPVFIYKKRLTGAQLPGTAVITPYGNVSIEDVKTKKYQDQVLELVVSRNTALY